MKTKTIALTALMIFFCFPIGSFAQDWGVGIRLGDPSGISVKKYGANNAMELSFGRTRYFHEGYYRDHFAHWYKNKKYGYYDYRFDSYRANFPFGIQFHYLWQKDLTQVMDKGVSGLDWYFGIGAQFRYQTFSYYYSYKYQGDPYWTRVYGERVTDIDIGPDAVIGLEYTFSKVPISMFLDATLLMEVVDDPFYFWMMGGLGFRYNL